MNQYQKEVDEWFKKEGWEYWEPHRHPQKPRQSREARQGSVLVPSHISTKPAPLVTI